VIVDYGGEVDCDAEGGKSKKEIAKKVIAKNATKKYIYVFPASFLLALFL